VRGDALKLPFADGAFDKVICAEVLEHLGDDSAAMVELARVLRPGGLLAVSVPRFGPEIVNWALSERYHAVAGGHVRVYRRRQLLERFSHAGLEVVATHHAHALHSPYWWLRCLVGIDREDCAAVNAYHRLLVWDITAHTPITRVPERLLNPVLGKSLVAYLRHAGR
jgi:SAM-dependent methyltransferase